MYAWDPKAFALDTAGALFYTLGPRSAELVVQNNRLINPNSGLAPSFVHAPNNWDLSGVDDWLAGLN